MILNSDLRISFAQSYLSVSSIFYLSDSHSWPLLLDIYLLAQTVVTSFHPQKTRSNFSSFSSTKMPLPKTPHDRQFPDSFCHCGESFVALVEKTTGDLYVHLMNIWWTFDVKDRSLVLPAQISKNCPSSCSFWSRSPNSYQTPTRTAKWHHPTPLDICSRQN